MISSIIIALAMFAQGDKQELEPFDQMIWRTTAEIRGEYLCDLRTGQKQRRKFDALYAKRIEKLRKRYFAWHGPDSMSEDIIAAVCYPKNESFGINSRLHQKLKDFDLTLKKLERIYSHRQ